MFCTNVPYNELWYNETTDRYTTIPNHTGDMPEGTLRAIILFVNSLDEDNRNALIHMVDTMLTKQRMRELAAGKESV